MSQAGRSLLWLSGSIESNSSAGVYWKLPAVFRVSCGMPVPAILTAAAVPITVFRRLEGM